MLSSSSSNILLPIGPGGGGFACVDHSDLPDREQFSRWTVFGFSTVQHALSPC